MVLGGWAVSSERGTPVTPLGPVTVPVRTLEQSTAPMSHEQSTAHGHTVENAGFVPLDSEGGVNRFAPHQALKVVVRCKVTFGERVVVHRVCISACW